MPSGLIVLLFCGVFSVLYFGWRGYFAGFISRRLPSEPRFPSLRQLWPREGDSSPNHAKLEYDFGSE